MLATRPTIWRHLPNALSLLRLLSAGPIAWLILADHAVWAMACFIAAGLSDALDGWLAKRFSWQSQLGGWLDPLADKALVMTACVALAVHGDLPYPLLALIIARDVVIVAGAITFHFKYAPLHAAPTLVGKLTTLIMITMIVVLLWRNTGGAAPDALVDGLVYVCAALLLISGADYVRRWSSKARALRNV